MRYSVELHALVAKDLDRIVRHLLAHDATGIRERVLAVRDALRVLERNPFVGRPAGRFRELIIGEGTQTYLARYRVWEANRRVVVLAIRHAREVGFGR